MTTKHQYGGICPEGHDKSQVYIGERGELTGNFELAYMYLSL